VPFGSRPVPRRMRTDAAIGAASDASGPRAVAPRGCIYRRQVLAGGIVAAVGAATGRAGADENDEAKSRHPEAGDQFTFDDPTRKGTVITPDDIKPNAPQILCWPYDPAKKLALDGSRLNQLLLLRLDPASLSEAERPHAVDGIVAYSAICRHAGCVVSAWLAKEQLLLCPCHGSEYDPKDTGKPVFGPAPQPLARVPLKISGGVLAAAGGFIGHIGIAPMG
jgi:rieske iron-sulfur protein